MLFLSFVFFTRCYSISFSSQLNSDNTQNDANAKEFWVNMPNLMTHLKKVSEQKPQATYYNVDMLKYQVRLFIWSGCLFHITNVYFVNFAKMYNVRVVSQVLFGAKLGL